MNEAFEKWIADQDKYNPPTHKEAFRAGMLAEAVPQCTHEYEIDSDHPNHSCCQNCGEILKDGVHVQPVAQARSRAGMLAAAEMERSKGNDKSTRSVPEDDRNNGIKQLGHIRTHPMDE